MAVSTAETRSCWQSLQFVWCWQIFYWFYLIVNKTGMGNHHKIVFRANSSQSDPKFNLCVTPSPLDPNSVWVLRQKFALEGNTILTKMKRILQGDSKVSKHIVWAKKQKNTVWYPCMPWWDQQFPGHWIGRRGTVERPPMYPNLTPLQFLLVGAFEGHDVTGENTKCGKHKRTHYRCFCAPNTRCATAISPRVGEKNSYELSKYCCPYRQAL
jgi:hypothetical protein